MLSTNLRLDALVFQVAISDVSDRITLAFVPLISGSNPVASLVCVLAMFSWTVLMALVRIGESLGIKLDMMCAPMKMA